MKKGYVNIFAGADTHCGHDVGLTPPGYNFGPAKKSSHKIHKDYAFRKAGWGWFITELKKAGPFDIAIWNGDLIDGQGLKSGGTEDLEIPVQVDMAVEVVKTVAAPRNWFVRGTGYHVGDNKTTWEDMVCNLTDSTEIGDAGHYWVPDEKHGILINAKHKIGNSSSPISQFTALSSARIKQLMWAETGQQDKANLLLRAHIHRCQTIAEPERNRAVWTMPALQGLGSVYGGRAVDGLPVHFGFLVIKVKNVDDWGVEAHIAPMTMQKAHALVYNKTV